MPSASESIISSARTRLFSGLRISNKPLRLISSSKSPVRFVEFDKNFPCLSGPGAEGDFIHFWVYHIQEWIERRNSQKIRADLTEIHLSNLASRTKPPEITWKNEKIRNYSKMNRQKRACGRHPVQRGELTKRKPENKAVCTEKRAHRPIKKAKKMARKLLIF